MRKFFITILAILILSSQLLAQQCPMIGAIRWDAWHGDKGPVGAYVEKVLTPEKWHYRLPFCAKILNDKVKIDCANPEAMTKEIEYASEGKLDFWAFVTYDPDNPMNLQLMEFIKNPKKDRMSFALILEFGRWSLKNYSVRNNFIANLIKERNYLKIDGRSVIFIFNITKWEERLYEHWGGPEKFKELVINDLTSKIKEKPYFIVMEFDPEKAAYWANIFGFDAISTYAAHPNRRGTYEYLAKSTISYWNRAKKTGKTVIPIVMTGWDPRPRAENPAPWEGEKYTSSAKEVFFESPKPEEIANLLREAIRWAKTNKSPAIIIYAWNELDEGGWIMPTLFEGDKRIKAIRRIINEECSLK